MEAELAEDVRQWGHLTTIGILLGSAYGGLREARELAPEREAVLPSQHHLHRPQQQQQQQQHSGGGGRPASSEPVLTERDVWRARRDASERALLRITRASVVGGARVGLFVGALGGAQVALAHARGRRDAWNSAGAGAVAAGAFGIAASPGALATRLSAGAVFALVGGCLSLPIGWLQSINAWSLQQISSEELKRKSTASGDSGEKQVPEDGAQVGYAIERLERSLRSRESSPST